MIKTLRGHDEKLDKLIEQNVEIIKESMKNEESELYNQLEEAFPNCQVATAVGVVVGLILGAPIDMLSQEINEDNAEEVLDSVAHWVIETFEPFEMVKYELKK